MKKLKLLPSVLMLALCVGILGIGIYAATPTNNVITGTITVNAANAGIKVEVFEGQETTGEAFKTATGRTQTEIDLANISIDASNALSLEDVPVKYYTIRFSTTSTHKFIVDTETIQLIDGKISESEIKEEAIIITKNHKKYLEDNGEDGTGLAYFTADIKDGETITTDNSYLITIAIRLGELPEQAFGATLNMQFDVHKLTDWVEAGNTGINGIDYLHYGEYPQTLAATTLDGYTLVENETFSTYDKTTGGKMSRQVYTDGEERYILMTSITEWGWDNEINNHNWTTTGTYLYRIEPLKWDILERDSGTGRAKLRCNTIIEQVRFQYAYENDTYYAKDYLDNYVLDDAGNKVIANNYEYSLLRSFMNDTFYNSAFNMAEQSVMLLEKVDNSMVSTGQTGTNAYLCNDTYDYIFALCGQDMRNGDYNFPADSGQSDKRIMYPSNYASATGAYTYSLEYMLHSAEAKGFSATKEGWIEFAKDTSVGLSLGEDAEVLYDLWQNSGFWWLRSPNKTYAYQGTGLARQGSIVKDSVNSDLMGCVPALIIGL